MYVCRKLCVQVDSCMRIARVSFGLIFQKLIYLFTKSYIFHFNTSQVNLTSDWALNQSWVLEISIIGERRPKSYGVHNAVSTTTAWFIWAHRNKTRLLE